MPERLLDRLRVRIPKAPTYMDRRRRGRLIARWALIMPEELLAGSVEEPA